MDFLDIPLTTIDGEQTSLRTWERNAVLIVNVASKCGFTKQYAALQRLWETYRDRGLVVLGFPCNQFLGQEPGTEEEIAAFCSTTFGVDFPLFAKGDVAGDDKQPLFAALEHVPDADGEAGEVKWNFEKVLLAPGGEPVLRFRTQIEPDDDAVIAAIEDALPQPASAGWTSS